jgi:hypothetical protein
LFILLFLYRENTHFKIKYPKLYRIKIVQFYQMTSTIESTNNTILLKIQYLHDILCNFNNCKISVKYEYIKELKSISEEYEMGSIKILSDYFLIVHNYKNDLKNELTNELAHDCDNKIIEDFQTKKIQFNKQKDRFFRDYQIFVRKENFIGKMDRLYMIFKNITQSNINKNAELCKCLNDIKLLFSKYNNSTIVQTVNPSSYNKCPDCNKDMKILPSSSEIVCIGCGRSEILNGTVFEDEQFYYQEGQRTKHGSYDSTKHCKFWIERIQARESKAIPESVINSIKNSIRHNNIKNIEEITCEEIRKYLRQTKNTSYNEHIPLIRKIITGVTPPQLTDREVQLIVLIFSKAVKIYEEIKPPDKTNVMYHPYPIYKIIEHILKAPNMKRRRNAILSCIHLQSRETLIENDIIWEKVCKYIDIEYVPTDRNIDLDLE